MERKTFFCSLVLVVFLRSLSNAELVEQVNDKVTLDKVKSNPSGSVVFFNHPTKIKGKETVNFQKRFSSAAEALKDFGVRFYFVDCNSQSKNEFKDECSTSRDYVIVYSMGNKDELELALLFDEDHIVGHVLMFLLQGDVAVAQDEYMWNDVLMDSKGSKDIILAYVKGLGDKEHRYFMEAAFVYGKEYKFVLTTENSMPGLKGGAALLYYHCKDASEEKDCPVKARKSPPNSVLDVVRFIKLDGLSRVLEFNEYTSSILEKQDMKFPVYKVYLFSKDVKKARKLAEGAAKNVEDSVFFILINVVSHLEMLPKFGVYQGADWDNGAISVVLQPAHLASSEQEYYEQWPLDLEINEKNLVDLLKQYHANPNDVFVNIVKMVNVIYKSISNWEKPNQGITVVGGCMKELPDCVGFNIAFRRIARSIVLSQIEALVDIMYVDFTNKPEDAKLNNIPGFMIYKNGEEVKHKGPLNYESLLSFIWENLDPVVLRLPPSGSDHIPLAPEEYEYYEEKNEEHEWDQLSLLTLEDDAMGKLAVDIVAKKLTDDNVSRLTDKTFNATKEANDLMVTLFILPWCVKSIVVKGPFAKVAQIIEESASSSDVSTAINIVNCFNWEDVCRKENVVSYPTVKVYRKGLKPFVYTDSLGVETMVATVRRYQAPVLQELTDRKSIEAFLDHEASSLSLVSVIGLFSSKDSKELQAFKDAAENLFGSYLFAFAAGSVAQESAQGHQFPVPSFVLVKRNDPVEHFTGSKDFGKIKEFIQENSIPLYGEMTALNFPKYKQYGKPFVINFKDANDSKIDETMKVLAIQASSVFVTWMDKGKSVTRDIMRVYLKNSTDSAVVFVSHAQGKVYKYSGNFTDENLLEWVNNCVQENVRPTSTLSDKKWKPLRKGINYLEMVDEDEAKRNEQGEAYTREQEAPGDEDRGDDSNGSDQDDDKETEDFAGGEDEHVSAHDEL